MQMPYDRVLEIVGNSAAVLTAIVATFGYGRYHFERVLKRRQLEAHLREEKAARHDGGRRTVLQLMARLRMTQGDVLDAAFRSRKVRAGEAADDLGRMEDLVFEYADDAVALDPGRRRQF